MWNNPRKNKVFTEKTEVFLDSGVYIPYRKKKAITVTILQPMLQMMSEGIKKMGPFMYMKSSKQFTPAIMGVDKKMQKLRTIRALLS